MKEKEPTNADDIKFGRQMSLKAWLEATDDPFEEREIISYCFPTMKHREEFLRKIKKWPDDLISRVIQRFLIPSGSLGCDDFNKQMLQDAMRNNKQRAKILLSHGYYKRLLWNDVTDGKVEPWEGITWVLDLLPHSPRSAIDAIDAYLGAHAQVLPDGRIDGLYDAKAIIRAKYILSAGRTSTRVLNSLNPREFERLIARLYRSMGYETNLTPPQNDGGRDIIASKEQPGRRDRVLVECKHYSDPVGVEIVRQILGVVSHEKANKGTIVTTSRFTRGARSFAAQNRLELVDIHQLIPLLNEYLGAKWPSNIEYYVSEVNAPQNPG